MNDPSECLVGGRRETRPMGILWSIPRMDHYIDVFASLNPHLYDTPHPQVAIERTHTVLRNPPTIRVRAAETKANLKRFGFSESLYSPHTLRFANQTSLRHQPLAIRTTAERIAVNYRWASEYFHFLTEALPNAIFLHRLHPTASITCPLSAFTRPAFQWFGVPAPILAPQALPLVTKLTAPFVECGNPSKQKIDTLRAVVDSKVHYESTHGILIRRHGSRELLNEGDVLDYFKTTYPHLTWVVYDMLSIDDTAALFSKASLIVAPHGAGLTNMLFSPKGTVIVEFMPMLDPNVCYWHLSEMIGHTYSMIPVVNTLNGCMRVDIAELDVILHHPLNQCVEGDRAGPS